MGVSSFRDLASHYGHKIAVVVYGGDGNIGGAVNAAVECETCHEVLLDFDVDESKDIEVVWKALEEPVRNAFFTGFASGREEQKRRDFPDVGMGWDRDAGDYWREMMEKGGVYKNAKDTKDDDGKPDESS